MGWGAVSESPVATKFDTWESKAQMPPVGTSLPELVGAATDTALHSLSGSATLTIKPLGIQSRLGVPSMSGSTILTTRPLMAKSRMGEPGLTVSSLSAIGPLRFDAKLKGGVIAVSAETRVQKGSIAARMNVPSVGSDAIVLVSSGQANLSISNPEISISAHIEAPRLGTVSAKAGVPSVTTDASISASTMSASATLGAPFAEVAEVVEIIVGPMEAKAKLADSIKVSTSNLVTTPAMSVKSELITPYVNTSYTSTPSKMNAYALSSRPRVDIVDPTEVSLPKLGISMSMEEPDVDITTVIDVSPMVADSTLKAPNLSIVRPQSGATGFSINYDAIFARIKEVSTIDSEAVYFVKATKSDCPDCKFDPISGRSANSFCPTCNGKGVIDSIEKVPLIASVDRLTGFENSFQVAGRMKVGTVTVTVHESQLTEKGFNIDEDDWYSAVDHVLVGGRRYKFADGDSVIPQTLQGIIYEVIFHLTYYG